MIRYLSIHDYEKFVTLLNELGQTDISEDDFIEIYTKRLLSNTSTYVYVKNGEIIGTISYILEHKFLHGGLVCHIEDLVVQEGSRGKGTGGELVIFVENKAKELGCYKIILNCSIENRLFYEKLGFVGHEQGMRKNVS